MSQNHHFRGLTRSQIEKSRSIYGENILTPPKRTSLFEQFAEKFKDPIIIILLFALAMSIGVAVYQFVTGLHGVSVFLEPVGILLAILLATVVGFSFEVSANRRFEILNQVSDEVAVKVIRDSQICEIPKREVVVGDVVVLNTGDEVPADCELVEAIALQVNESTLTGEPVARKAVDPESLRVESTYPVNHILRGTTIAEGHCVARVTMVGDKTEYGKVYEGSQMDAGVETPLNKQLDRLARLITKVSYGIATLILVGRAWVYLHSGLEVIDWLDFGGYMLNSVMIAVTLIVVAVPEGLPMSVTLSLALSMKRMLSTNNLVRKMHACETMGATTVICTDKTGTLTKNQMRVYDLNIYAMGGGDLCSNTEVGQLFSEGVAVNSTADLGRGEGEKFKVLGNPTEGALLLWLASQDVNYQMIRENVQVVDQLTFSTERKYMATIVNSSATGRRVLYVKGAPEIVFGLSNGVLTENGLQSCDSLKTGVEEQLLSYQSQAMRTLGFAYQILEEGDDREYIKDGALCNTELVFLGVVAISDPIREEVPQAISECLAAGIGVKIVTGDTSATAKEIGRQIGLWSDSDSDQGHITGSDLAALSDEELSHRVMDLKIISRARPMDKQRIVQLLQQQDQVVAVTGDGTNDAPALKAAQVGLSMGDGTAVAKEASDITILDNSFSSISRAVMWGRSLYQNIQRFILFQMTINVVACLIVLIGAFLGTESPLTVTQMLWVNLIMDTFAALALASLPPSQKVMNRAPRSRSAHIITTRMAVAILGVGAIFVAFLFGLIQYFKHVDIVSLTQFDWAEYAKYAFDFSSGFGLSPYELSLFFTTFVMLQFWNMFNAKAFLSGRSAFAAIEKSKGFILTALFILVGQWVIVTFGGEMFGVVPLAKSDWLIVIVGTSVVLIVGEIVRFFVLLGNIFVRAIVRLKQTN